MNDYVKSEYIAHHGVQGMHWGVRRYQPYPSDYSGDGVYKGEPKKSFRERHAEQKRIKEAKKYADKYMTAKMGSGV